MLSQALDVPFVGPVFKISIQIHQYDDDDDTQHYLKVSSTEDISHLKHILPGSS